MLRPACEIGNYEQEGTERKVIKQRFLSPRSCAFPVSSAFSAFSAFSCQIEPLVFDD